MSLNRQLIQLFFEEEVGRSLSPELAESIAAIIGDFTTRLARVDPASLLEVEPSIAFQPGYPITDEKVGEVTV
jgi:hypothetical protein